MSITLFGNKKTGYVRKVKRNDVRKPNVSSNIVGDIIEKPRHVDRERALAEKKKKLLKEKSSLLKKSKKRRTL